MNGLGFTQVGEQFGVEQFVAKAAAEAFSITVLPGRAGFDVQRRDARLFQEAAQGLGDELRAVGRGPLGHPTLDGIEQYLAAALIQQLRQQIERQWASIDDYNLRLCSHCDMSHSLPPA